MSGPLPPSLYDHAARRARVSLTGAAVPRCVLLGAAASLLMAAGFGGLQIGFGLIIAGKQGG
jgi:hypothetical protein